MSRRASPTAPLHRVFHLGCALLLVGLGACKFVQYDLDPSTPGNYIEIGAANSEVHHLRSAGTLAGFVAPASYTQSAVRPTESLPCEGAGVPMWVTHMRDRLTQVDRLSRFAIARYGAPTACEGEVTSVFDGNEFGRVMLTFAGGVTFAVETQPSEASMATLRAPAGFADTAAVGAALREYTGDIGVDIDWTSREISSEGAETVHRYKDPDDGLNAFASLYFRGDTLVAVRFSLAL